MRWPDRVCRQTHHGKVLNLVQRFTNLAGGFQTLTTNASGNSFTDTTATNGGSFFYRVGVQ